MNNDTISARQIAGWLVDAEHVLRTADESSEEYAAARTISTLCMALLGTGGELQDLRARNQEVESLLAVQQRAIDTQRAEINSLKSGEPVGYLVGTALLENLTQATAYRDETGLEIKPLFTSPPVLVVSNETGLPADASPVAWEHTMDTTEGIPGEEPLRQLSYNPKHPFGIAGENYSRDFPVYSRPLYVAPQLAAWYPAETSPDVPRGEFLDCWVAGCVYERDNYCKPAKLLVLLARWGGTELLRGDEGGWSFDERLPDGGLKILAWQPIVKPDYPLGAL